MNGTQAAIRAGYSEKTANEQSSRLLAKIHIQTRISELAKAITKRNGITPERILNELAILGFSRIDDHLVIDEGGGVRIKRFDEYDDEAKLAAIRKIKEDRVIREVPKADGTEEVVVHDKISFELHDKIRPLVKLGEYVKLFDSELPGGGVSQVVNNDFKIMIMAVNGDKIKEIDFSKMIETGKKQANVE
jgi:phage terminase small subunit